MKILSIALSLTLLVLTLRGATGEEAVTQHNERTCKEYLEVIGEEPNSFKEKFWEYVCSYDADKA